MTDYEAVAADTLNIVKKYVESDGWKPWKTSNGLTMVYKDSSDFDGNVYKSSFELDVSPDTIIDLVWDIKKREKWQSSVLSNGGLECVEKINEDLIVLRSMSTPQMKGLITSRDFIDVFGRCRCHDDNCVIIYWSNTTHPTYSDSVKGHVRGHNYPSAFFVYPVEGNPKQTRGLNIFQIDGHLRPKIITDRFLPNLQFDMFADIKKAVKQIA
ncbi:stAR-related lipid transfer protein 5-like [Glandiceps talaboti]